MNINYVDRKITCKIVYYGPGLSGKTTNLATLCKLVGVGNDQLISLNTEDERTIFFDYMAVQEVIRGFKVKVSFYTVPGQPIHHATRKLVLSGADAVVFIADSDAAKIEENKTALHELRLFLQGHNLNLDTIPYVLQLNKRDLPDAESVENMKRELAFKNEQIIEAVATEAKGVIETKNAIVSELIDNIRDSRL